VILQNDYVNVLIPFLGLAENHFINALTLYIGAGVSKSPADGVTYLPFVNYPNLLQQQLRHDEKGLNRNWLSPCFFYWYARQDSNL
jgi:hypothetical protein